MTNKAKELISMCCGTLCNPRELIAEIEEMQGELNKKDEEIQVLNLQVSILKRNLSRYDRFGLAEPLDAAGLIDMTLSGQMAMTESITMTKPTYEELQAQVERLRVHGTRCANELVYMINTHNEYNINDDSYKYDHQTPVEFLEVSNETPAQSLAALKAQWQAEADQYEDGMPAQKAFWEGFERGSVAGGNNLNIRAHWREYVGFKTGANK